MLVLSVNAGSSSLKFTGFMMPEEKNLISGYFERIGLKDSFYSIKINGEKIKKDAVLNTHEDAVKLLVEELLENKIINSLDEIKLIGHRIVHGGDYFDRTVIATEEVINKIEELSTLAPLHNPPAVVGIRAFQSIIPTATATVVFDTAFHQTMKEETYMYALPYEFCEKYKVRRYGAHGTSHKYIAERMAEKLNRNDLKLIVCHLGSGASITAIKDGKCVNTSMGFTPNAGLVMGTRCGDIDATILPYLINKFNFTPEELDKIMNKQSGYIGISGVGSDSREIEDGVQEGNERCILAQNMFIRRVIDYIAKYYFELEGVDAIVFTAGIGENAVLTRGEIVKRLAFLGVELDEQENNFRGEEKLITTPTSSIPVYVVPTNEELMIARESYELVKE